MPSLDRLIESVDAGDMRTADELLPLVYDELRRLAQARLNREQAGQSLQPTDLVHEAYGRMIGSSGDAQGEAKWNSVGHFFAAAAEAMRRVLIDRARAKATAKRGGSHDRRELSGVALVADENPERFIELDEALTRFEREHPDKATLVKMRFFMGMTMQQIAETFEISTATAQRHWAYARAWLKTELESCR